jgi:16S rRNA G1207 methylase RsmC
MSIPHDNSEAAAVSRLESNIILPIKRKYLNATDNIPANSADEKNQDVETVLGRVGKNMHELHAALKEVIEETVNKSQKVGGANRESIESLKQLLNQEGILEPLKGNPALKEALLLCLNLHLIEYPYSLGKHAHTLDKIAIESHPNEIIPNTI